MVIVGSVGLTLLVWKVSSTAQEERSALRLEQESERVVGLFTEQLQRHADLLQATASLLAAREKSIRHDEWKRYHDGLELPLLFPALSSINLVHHVRRDEAEAFVEARRLDYPEYALHPQHDQPFHLPVAHSSGSVRADALGFDMAHETVRRSAVARAMQSGRAQISAPIQLTYSKTTGFLMFAPFYRGAADGWKSDRADGMAGAVFALMRTASLAAGVLDQSKRDVLVKISDGGETLYDEQDANRTGAAQSEQTPHTVKVPVFGREWQFDVIGTAGFHVDAESEWPTLILVAGLLINLLLLIMFTMLSRANRRALSFADRMVARFRTQSAELRESNRELEAFACVVSHDLKSPLRGIGVLANIIEEDLEDQVSSDKARTDMEHNFKRLHRQVDRGLALIAGVLAYSRVGEVMGRSGFVDTRDMVVRIVDGHQVADGAVELRGDFPVLHTYAIRLDQVFANLIGNAFKYHPDAAAARVVISAEAVGKSGELHRFTVADNGPGIDPRYHDRIFELFSTLQSRDSVESTGVGLAIVKKTIERIGGTISVSSDVGAGCAFTFEWPAPLFDATRRQNDALDDAVSTQAGQDGKDSMSGFAH